MPSQVFEFFHLYTHDAAHIGCSIFTVIKHGLC